MLVALRGEALRPGDACTFGTDTRSSGAAGGASSALAAAAAGAGANEKGAAGFRRAAITLCSQFAVSLQPPIGWSISTDDRAAQHCRGAEIALGIQVQLTLCLCAESLTIP